MNGLLRDPLPGVIDEPLSAPPDWNDPPDTEQARAALNFIQNCPHTKGDLRDQKKRLADTWLPWQEKYTRHLFGTVDADGRRIYRVSYNEQPKKSGKSHWLAAAMLYLLGPGTKPGGELYSAAYDHGQAMVVWEIARQMCQIAGWAGDRLDIRNYQGCWEIENPEEDSIYKPLTRKAASKHGFNPYAVAFDELHQQPDRELWDTIDGSMGAWSEPLLIAITNSGYDRETVCYEQRRYAMALNEGEFSDPNFLGVVYGTPNDVDGVGTRDDWQRANPGVPVTVSLDVVEGKARKADRQASELNPFRRWQLGIWTQQATKWIDAAAWQRAETSYTEADLKGRTCYGGLDLGSASDLSAWVLAFPWENTVRFLLRAWCPEARIHDRANPYRSQYQAWVREGWLETVPGEVMDTDPVERQIVEDAKAFGLVDMAMDRKFQGIDLSIRLTNRHGIDVAGIGTGYRSMSAPCSEFERRLRMDPPRITHDGNPVLRWAVGNVALKARSDDEMMPTKDSREAKIDPVVAALYAFDRAMRHEASQGTKSVYEDRGLRSVGVPGGRSGSEATEGVGI